MSKGYLVSRHFGGRYAAHHAEVYQLLGLDPKAHLPLEGLPERDVQGVRVRVRSRAETPRGQHRVMARCNGCQREFSFAGLAQHVYRTGCGKGE